MFERADDPARSVGGFGRDGSGCVAALDKGDVVDVTIRVTQSSISTAARLHQFRATAPRWTMTGGAVIDAGAAYITAAVHTTCGAALDTTRGTFTGTAPTIDDPTPTTISPAIPAAPRAITA